MKGFETEIREAFDKQYIKVFLKDQEKVETVKNLLEQLESIRRINFTESSSGGVKTMTLTVYPQKAHDVEEVEQEIRRYLTSINWESPVMQQVDKENTMNCLHCCPDAEELYKQALMKYNSAVFERNVLDDMRLCLELFLKKKLNNEKSLENQIDAVGRYQKERGCSSEFVNMFKKLLDYYCRYQNEHVKHNDKVNPKEIDFVMKLTMGFINSFSG